MVLRRARAPENPHAQKPNHRFWIIDRNGNGFFKTASELFKERNNHWKFPKKGIWKGEYEEYFTIKGIPKEHVEKLREKKFKEKASSDIKIKSEDFFAFLGIYLADGSSKGVNSKKNGYGNGYGYEVKITQKKEKTKKLIRELISRLPFHSRERHYGDGKVDFIIPDIRLHSYLIALGNSHNKYIPKEIKQASPELLKTLLDWFLMGDGRTIKFGENKKYTRRSVFSTSKKLILDLQEILLKSGGHGNITQEEPKDRIIHDEKIIEEEIDVDGLLEIVKKVIRTPRLIKAENSKTKYNLNFSRSEFIYLDKRNLKIEKIEDYDNTVHCVRVPNGIIYTMRNGKSSWTGNSSVVNLLNTSHMVVDMWWEGKVLYGKVVLFDENPAGAVIKGILKKGGVLGISSRGVGSVKSIRGNDVVQDDFELIGFDFVSSPSTLGAYMFKENKKNDKKVIMPSKAEIETNIQKITTTYNKLQHQINNDFWKEI